MNPIKLKLFSVNDEEDQQKYDFVILDVKRFLSIMFLLKFIIFLQGFLVYQKFTIAHK